MIHFKDNKSKSALSTRWAQMTKQEQIIEKKKIEIQAKAEAQKQAAALAAQAKLANPGKKEEQGSSNIFSNDGSFLNQYKFLLQKQKRDVEVQLQKEKQKALEEELKNAPKKDGKDKKQQAIKREEEFYRETLEQYESYHEDRQPKKQRDGHRRWNDRGRMRGNDSMSSANEDRRNVMDSPHIPSLMQMSIRPPDNESGQSNDCNKWDNRDSNDGNYDMMSMLGPGPMNAGCMGPGAMRPGAMNAGPMGHGSMNLGPMGSGSMNSGPMGRGSMNGPMGPMGPGPNMGPGSNMGPGPNMRPGSNMGPGPNMGPRPFMGSGPNTGLGTNMGPGQNMGPGPNMTPGPNMGHNMEPGSNMGSGTNMGSGSNTGTGSNMGSGSNIGHGSNMSSMGSGQNMGPPSVPNMPPPPGIPGPPCPPAPPAPPCMPPFMGGPNFPMPPHFMGPNGPGSMMPNMSGPNGPMPPFFGPPFPPNPPMMGPNGPPNSMNPMSFMGPRPPFGTNGPNFGNGNGTPFIAPGGPPLPDSKPDVPLLPLSKDDSSNTPQVLSTDDLPPAVLRAADEVSRNGDHWENVLKAVQDQNLWFLHNTNSYEYKKFRELVIQFQKNKKNSNKHIKPEDRYEPEFSLEEDDDTEYRTPIGQASGNYHKNKNIKREASSSQSDEDGEKERRKRRKSRWGDDPPVDIKPPGVFAPQCVPGMSSGLSVPMPPLPPMPGPTLSKIDGEGLRLTTVTRTNPALLQYAITNYGTTNLSAEDWKKCEDNFKLNLLYQDMLKKRQEVERMAYSGKNKYEYDSDEDTTDGTWEHRLRLKEMSATERWASELTKQAAGKHHIGDFLPPEELKKFMEKYSAVRQGKEPDLSDYKEYKLKEDNVGFKMLQKLGWTEGQGLGIEGTGIVNPINKANQPVANLGLGAASSDAVAAEDDEFDAYRKRMMLAYRFRPNPLNNPRRPYY